MLKRLTAAMMLTAATTALARELPRTLDAMRHEYRPLLIFAGAHDAHVEDQWSVLVEHRKDAGERQIATVLLTTSHTKMHDGNRPLQATFDAAEEQQLRLRFRIAPDQFTVILVGKDGSEKLRSEKPIPWETLQSTIDSMPMRQQEMRPTAR